MLTRASKRRSSRIPIALFASGRGSNAEAIVKACARGALRAEIVALVCDRADAPVMEKARAWRVPVIDVSGFGRTEGAARDARVVEGLSRLPNRPVWGVLAGYLRVVGPEVLQFFKSDRGYSRVVNIHPSLLPAFPGLHGYRQAFEHGCQLAGATVHLVDAGLDSGPICEQRAFEISDCQSADDVEKLGLVLEHQLFVDALKWVLPEDFSWRPGQRVVKTFKAVRTKRGHKRVHSR